MHIFKIVLVLIFSLCLHGGEIILAIDKSDKELSYYKNGRRLKQGESILDNLAPINKDDNVTILMTKNVSFDDMQFFLAYVQKVGGQNYKYYIIDDFGRVQEFYFSRIIRKHKYRQYIPK